MSIYLVEGKQQHTLFKSWQITQKSENFSILPNILINYVLLPYNAFIPTFLAARLIIYDKDAGLPWWFRRQALSAMQEIQVQSLDQEDPLKKGKATRSNILSWKIPGTEEPGRLQSKGLQKVGHDWVTNTFASLSWQGYNILSYGEHRKIIQSSL